MQFESAFNIAKLQDFLNTVRLDEELDKIEVSGLLNLPIEALKGVADVLLDPASVVQLAIEGLDELARGAAVGIIDHSLFVIVKPE